MRACSMSEVAERASAVACARRALPNGQLRALSSLQARMQSHQQLWTLPRRPLATKGMHAAIRLLLTAALVLPPMSAHPHHWRQPMTRWRAARTG